MSEDELRRHARAAYNNRYLSSSTDDDHPTSPTRAVQPQLYSLSECVDLFGHSPHFGQAPHPPVTDRQPAAYPQSPTSPQSPTYPQSPTSPQSPTYPKSPTSPKSPTYPKSPTSPKSPTFLTFPPSYVNPPAYPGSPTHPGSPTSPTSLKSYGYWDRQQSLEEAARPGKQRPPKPTSADRKRQQFQVAASPPGQGGGRNVVTSTDSACDDVFVEVDERRAGGLRFPQHPSPYDSSLFPPHAKTEATFSTSSTASILPNPYNRVNHKIHSLLWCCSCLYFVFFCCLPAIHYMEQSDTEFGRDNQKRARSLGRRSTFLFFTGTLVALSVFALLFFLAIFFSVY